MDLDRKPGEKTDYSFAPMLDSWAGNIPGRSFGTSSIFPILAGSFSARSGLPGSVQISMARPTNGWRHLGKVCGGRPRSGRHASAFLAHTLPGSDNPCRMHSPAIAESETASIKSIHSDCLRRAIWWRAANMQKKALKAFSAATADGPSDSRLLDATSSLIKGRRPEAIACSTTLGDLFRPRRSCHQRELCFAGWHTPRSAMMSNRTRSCGKAQDLLTPANPVMASPANRSNHPNSPKSLPRGRRSLQKKSAVAQNRGTIP